MRGVVFLITGILLATVILSVGCGTKPTPAPAAAPTQNVTGVLTDVNTPAEPGKDVVVVQTPQGQQTLTITADTRITLDGDACPLEDIGKLVEAGNVTYNCTAIYDQYYNVVELAVLKPVK